MTLFSPQIAQSLLDQALSLGADFADIFVERQQRQQISCLNQQVESVQQGIDFGIGIRLLFGTQVVYGYSNNLQQQSLSQLVAELAKRYQNRDPRQAQPLAWQMHPQQHPSQRTLLQDPAVDEKVQFLLAADRQAKLGERISTTKSWSLQRQQWVEIFNSQGLHCADERNYLRVGLTAICQQDGQQFSGSENFGGQIGWELAGQHSASGLGEEAKRQALINASAKPCPSGRMPVVIGNGFGGVIFHEACGHLLETTSVAKKASVFHDKLGQTIAHPCVNAVDSGLESNAWGSLTLDDEGMPTQRTQLIKDGQLAGFLVDYVGSLQTGYARTGSGRRESYRFAPASRMRNTYIEPGQDSFDDMIASIDKGIFAARMGGGSVQPGTGEFNFAVTEGYYVENGKIQHPVKACTLISTGPEVLKEISMVGDDLALACGMCGSVSGSIPASVGQPSLKVNSIVVGGNA